MKIGLNHKQSRIAKSAKLARMTTPRRKFAFWPIHTDDTLQWIWLGWVWEFHSPEVKDIHWSEQGQANTPPFWLEYKGHRPSWYENKPFVTPYLLTKAKEFLDWYKDIYKGKK